MELEPITCGECGVAFGVPKAWMKSRREDRKTWYCPNGHSRSFRESTSDGLRRERDLLAQQIAQRDDEIRRQREQWHEAEKRADAAERKVKRVEKRAHAGLCPCCNRSFSELAKHIATKHPTFRAEDVARENVVAIVKGRAA